MEFSNEIGRIQRLMAASMAGISRRSAVMNAMSLNAGGCAIDIGCGAGHLLIELSKTVGVTGRIYGVDPSEDQVNQARKNCSEYSNIEFIQSSAEKIPLPDGSCDLVTSTQTLEYIPDVNTALDECVRLMGVKSEFINISILWDYFKFYGAENKLNAQIHEVFKDHCSHQMLPMELDGRLAERGLLHIKHVPFPIMVTRRDENSVARYAEAVIATFARNNGVNAEKVDTWRKQLEIAEKNGRFGFTTFPVLTIGYSK